MGGKGSSVPEIDMESLVRTQGAINRPDVHNPYGSSEWSSQGDHYTQQQQFSPEMQALFEGQQDLMSQGPAQYRAQPLPTWAQGIARGAIGRVNDRFGFNADTQGALKPRQQRPPGIDPIDLEQVRLQSQGAGQGAGPGAGQAAGRYTPSTERFH